MEDKKFCESNWAMDVKILLMAVCCALGYLSHFYFKFPSQSLEVGLCLAGYCILMAAHYMVETYVEKGAFYIGTSHDVS